MPPENPFSSRFIRPGALPYGLPPGRDLHGVAARFDAIGRAGQIVGPHGSGKSTLLADLVRFWETNGRPVAVIELHDGQRRLPIRLTQLLHGKRPVIIAVDGYEQLGCTARWGLHRFCRRHRMGLVVTAHRSMGMPDLARCAPGLERVRSLVHELLRDGDCQVPDDKILAAFDRHQGNVREVLFELYDFCEEAAAS